MDFLVFWKKYEAATELISLVDELLEILKQDLSIYDEEYEIGETVFDFLIDLESANEYGRIIEVSLLFRENNPELYQAESTYINSSLIDYALFLNDKELLEESLRLYLESSGRLDFLESVLSKILYHGHMELLRGCLGHLPTDSEKYNKIAF